MTSPDRKPYMIRTDTDAEITLTGGPTDDGRILITHTSDGCLEVIDFALVALVNNGVTRPLTDILAEPGGSTDRP